MRNNGRMDASPPRAANQLPRGWTWERFRAPRYPCRPRRKRRPRRRRRRVPPRPCGGKLHRLPLRGVAFGDKFIQLGDWRISDIDGRHLSIASAKTKKTTMIYRSDGKPFHGPRKDFQAFNRRKGRMQRIAFG